MSMAPTTLVRKTRSKSASLGDEVLHGPHGVGLHAHIARDGHDVELFGGLPQAGLVAPGDGDPRALLLQRGGDAAPDALAAAGDQRPRSLDLHVRSPLLTIRRPVVG